MKTFYVVIILAKIIVIYNIVSVTIKDEYKS